MTKTCLKCLAAKPLREFSLERGTKDGHQSRCKACQKLYRAANRERIQAQAKLYRETEEYAEQMRRGAKRYRAKHPERVKAFKRQWIKTSKGRAYETKRQREGRARNPEKFKARMLLNVAVRSGKVKRLPCARCGNPKTQGHHEDYSKPLEVEWLCRKCHNEAHACLKRGMTT